MLNLVKAGPSLKGPTENRRARKGKNGNPSEPKSKKGKPHSGLEVSDSHGENQDGGPSIESESEGERGSVGGEKYEEGSPRSSSSPQLKSSSSNTGRSFPGHQGKEGNKEKEVDSRVSGNSTEGRNRASSRWPSPTLMSAYGYKPRIGSIPDPAWLEKRQRKRSLYLDNKDRCINYRRSRRIWDPPVDSNYDHVMIHKVADLLQYRSLAMLLSISRTRLPNMNARDRGMTWADSFINYFGYGTC